MMEISNASCINSEGGLGCIALDRVQPGCVNGVCPFFKTKGTFNREERRSAKRCADLGIVFASRDEVIKILDQNYRYFEKRSNKKKLIPKVVQYNTQENTFTEFNDIGEASAALGMSITKLEVLIKKREEYKGFKYTYL